MGTWLTLGLSSKNTDQQTPSLHTFMDDDITSTVQNYYPVAGYKITYSVATLSYDNYYVNLRDYSNFLLSGLL